MYTTKIENEDISCTNYPTPSNLILDEIEIQLNWHIVSTEKKWGVSMSVVLSTMDVYAKVTDHELIDSVVKKSFDLSYFDWKIEASKLDLFQLAPSSMEVDFGQKSMVVSF